MVTVQGGGRVIVVVAAAISLAAGVLYAQAHPGAVPEAALGRLLRAMAAIKMLIAALAGAAMLWRLGAPARPAWLAGYAAAAAAMAAGPTLIWNFSHIAAGALLLHGGLLAAILLLWRDPVTAARLDHVIAGRRARLRG
jgi:hypothetical protein